MQNPKKFFRSVMKYRIIPDHQVAYPRNIWAPFPILLKHLAIFCNMIETGFIVPQLH